MTYEELSDEDLLVLIGASRALINTDDLVSLQEMAWVRALVEQIGRERWKALAGQSEREFLHTDELIAALERLERPEVRTFILDEVRALAEADGLEPDEIAFLERLDTARGVAR